VSKIPNSLSALQAPESLGSRIQLKYQTSCAINSTPTTGLAGWGNLLVGVKRRFFDDENRGLFVSTYPHLEFNGER
jgi:hypothetical protein